jgi:hypothetical protein
MFVKGLFSARGGKGCSMWFLTGLFAGVVLGFFVAGLCNIAAKKEARCIEHCSDYLKREIDSDNAVGSGFIPARS